MKTRKFGTKVIMKPFKFMFACKLGELFLRETDIFPISLQESSISASQGKLTQFIK